MGRNRPPPYDCFNTLELHAPLLQYLRHILFYSDLPSSTSDFVGNLWRKVLPILPHPQIEEHLPAIGGVVNQKGKGRAVYVFMTLDRRLDEDGAWDILDTRCTVDDMHIDRGVRAWNIELWGTPGWGHFQCLTREDSGPNSGRDTAWYLKQIHLDLIFQQTRRLEIEQPMFCDVLLESMIESFVPGFDQGRAFSQL